MSGLTLTVAIVAEHFELNREHEQYVLRNVISFFC